MSLSKNQLKLITSLRQKKYRQKHKLFIAEGKKVVGELLNSTIKIEHLFVTEADFFNKVSAFKRTEISEGDLKKISTLKTPNNVLALFKIPNELREMNKGLIVALDGVNDPGNLGTIIRLCDWFGVEQLICSKNTVDCYNQKVIQSTMGSIARVQINYLELTSFLTETKLTIYSADMDGADIYEIKMPKEGVLIMGNEANGISKEVSELVKNKITIPRFGRLQEAESLNVATAAAILLSEFKRGSS